MSPDLDHLWGAAFRDEFHSLRGHFHTALFLVVLPGVAATAGLALPQRDGGEGWRPGRRSWC